MSIPDPHHGLIPGLRTFVYVYEPNHRLLAADAYKPQGPNIGRNGRNLTISFISLNRAQLSLRLLQSIGQHLSAFAGDVLVVDNGSEAEELEALRNGLRALPVKSRLVELGHNYGVAGGRNRAMDHVHTEWVLCLDNDIYFVTNPLTEIQRDLAILGCHFLNLPLLDSDGRTLFAKGGHLYPGVDRGALTIGAGSAYRQGAPEATPTGPFLSTFLFGGASVIQRATFESVGGYDEGMFVGFEDIDFSIRLFRHGLKVGNTACVALVHDHPPPDTEDDRSYERRRFSREVLRRSAEYLETKHHMKVWNEGVDAWLAARHAELGLSKDVPVPPAPVQATVARKPRIALITDTDWWAFWNISQQLCRHLSDRYEFLVIPTAVVDNVVHVFLMARECDLVHVFWREYLTLLEQPHTRVYVEYLGGRHADFLQSNIRDKLISTCIYDHLHLEPAALRARAALYRNVVNSYYVGSERLKRIYEAIPDFPRPAAVLPDGVDLELFYPFNLERFDDIGQREIVIGWTGNSKWSSELEDFKGVQTILRPAVEELIAEGLPVRLQLADRAEGGPMIPHREMVHYYSTIDVYICTSKIEGTPNPVLESMACGVPVITTDVGVVPEAFGSQQRDFILPERSISALQDALRRLVANPTLFRTLSAENLTAIQSWDWRHQAERFAAYFDACLARSSASVS